MNNEETLTFDRSKLLPWLYNGFEYFLPIGTTHETLMGFVYQVTNMITGKKYIGKKQFFSSKSKQVKGKKKKFKVESDWETYCGSSENLLKDVILHGPENFKREILYLCKTKSEESYWENYEIFTQHVLLNPDKFFNEWTSCKIRRKHLGHMIVVK